MSKVVWQMSLFPIYPPTLHAINSKEIDSNRHERPVKCNFLSHVHLQPHLADDFLMLRAIKFHFMCATQSSRWQLISSLLQTAKAKQQNGTVEKLLMVVPVG